MLAFLVAAPANAQLTPSSGKPLPELAFTDSAGKTHGLEPNKARLTAVHFWATWCTPCIAELAEVDEAQGLYGERGLRVIAISLDGNNMKKVTDFFAQKQIKQLTPYLDTYMRSFQVAKSPGLPTTLFIDSKGREIARSEGALDWRSDEVRAFLEDALK